jgi:hypothetical protein
MLASHSWWNRRTVAAVLAMGALAGIPAASLAGSEPERTNKTTSVTINNGNTIRAESENGKLTLLTVNGKPVPEDRITREGNLLIIKDESGNEIGRLDADGSASGSSQREAERARRDAERARRDAERIRVESSEIRARAQAAAAAARERARELNRTAQVESQPRLMIGVTPETPDESLADQLNLDADKVTLISSVTDGMPAAKAGLRRSDIIVEINGKTPAGPDELRKAIRDGKDGDELKLTVLRAGSRREVTVKLDGAFTTGDTDEDWNFRELEGLGNLDETLRDLPNQIEEGLKQGQMRGTFRLNRDGHGGMMVVPVPPVPGVPPTPGARNFSGGPLILMDGKGEELSDRLEALDDRLDALDERLDQIIEMLEKLAESKGRNP